MRIRPIRLDTEGRSASRSAFEEGDVGPFFDAMGGLALRVSLIAIVGLLIAGCAAPRQLGSLAASSEIAGVELWLADRKIGETRANRAPIVVENLAVGRYRVRARKPGYREWSREVEVVPNSRAVLSIELDLLEPPKLIRGEDGAEMVLVPAGQFWMGSDASDRQARRDEMPRHRVYLDSFYTDKYEVTNSLYNRFLEATGRPAPAYWSDAAFNGPTKPVVGVSWHDAQGYCRWAGKRLPTEAEREKAARGTDGRHYPWGFEWLDGRANARSGNPPMGTTAVGSFPRGESPYGAQDMAGNVWEWVQDWYDANYYQQSPGRNPMGPGSGEDKVLRGGSWTYAWRASRSAYRDHNSPDLRFNSIGFRCAKSLPEEERQAVSEPPLTQAPLSGRREFHGFSIMPPQGEGWTARTDPERGIPVSFSLGPPTPERLRTVLAMVTQTYLVLPIQDRTQLIQRLIESVEREQWGQLRYKRVRFETTEDRSLGTDCIRYVATTEDRGVPGYPVGSVSILEVRGFRCPHPDDPHMVLDIGYSQRFPLGQVWDSAFDARVEPFLKSFTFSALPESERRWELGRWARMMLDAKQARERGDRAEAESHCTEALRYAGASAVKSLYDYAALLQELNREGAEAARGRADKLRGSKSQGGGSVFLGFNPSDELRAYAGLLRELARGPEAGAMIALSDAWERANRAGYDRAQEQARGGDPRGLC